MCVVLCLLESVARILIDGFCFNDRKCEVPTVLQQVVCSLLLAAGWFIPSDHDAAVSEALLLADLVVIPACGIKLWEHVLSACISFCQRRHYQFMSFWLPAFTEAREAFSARALEPTYHIKIRHFPITNCGNTNALSVYLGSGFRQTCVRNKKTSPAYFVILPFHVSPGIRHANLFITKSAARWTSYSLAFISNGLASLRKPGSSSFANRFRSNSAREILWPSFII